MRAREPAMSGAIVKLNEGVSGAGNAFVDLAGLAPAGSAAEAGGGRATGAGDAAGEPRRAVRRLRREARRARRHRRAARDRRRGAQPSVQLRVLPGGDVELLSTHDQLLGGPGGQSYLGAKFPADFAYARSISAEARTVGARLAQGGGARPVRHRLRRRPAGRRGLGRRSRSRSTCARAARRTRS